MPRELRSEYVNTRGARGCKFRGSVGGSWQKFSSARIFARSRVYANTNLRQSVRPSMADRGIFPKPAPLSAPLFSEFPRVPIKSVLTQVADGSTNSAHIDRSNRMKASGSAVRYECNLFARLMVHQIRILYPSSRKAEF